MKQQIIILLAFVLSLFLTADLFGQTPEFDRLKENFEENRIFEAGFTHLYKDAFTDEEQFSEGKIWIGKEKYRIEGDTQTMVVDGEVSTVYDQSRNRVIISDYIEEEDDFAPSRMLQGVDDSFAVEENTMQNGETEITLTSEDAFTVFKTVTIYLDADGSPVQIVAIDQVDNELSTQFEDGFFTTAENNLFRVEVPAEAELIDLRYDSE
jgi:outer membrane lipoprotein-sorting protein